MTDQEYSIQRSNILAAKQLGLLTSNQAVKRLVSLEDQIARPAVGKLFTLKEREGRL